jgi:hypothetical protein
LLARRERPTPRAAQARFVRPCAALVFAVACVNHADDAVDTSLSAAAPTIVTASAECDTEKATWTFAVTTDAWTGNGQVVLSTDGDYVEKHTMYSSSAAADGSADSLELSLSVVPDWRDVTLGASTVFNCGEAGLTGILRVWTRDGDDEADCRAFGDAPERWDTWDAGVRCENVLSSE